MRAALSISGKVLIAVNEYVKANFLALMGIIVLLKSSTHQIAGNQEAGGLFAVAAAIFIVGQALISRR